MTPNSDDTIMVRSHVARDLLQSAGVFKTDKRVVWEYVSNGLQYVDPGTQPEVLVNLDQRAKRIVIIDNGRGMDWEALKQYFVMHGVNEDRRQGRAGRGMFGTGKSAAFGIADFLLIETVRDGKRSSVSLHRKDIDAMGSEAPVPVKIIEREVPVSEPNGTRIEIDDVHVRMNPGAVRSFIEQHLAHWRKDAMVWVNRHPCEFSEPPYSREVRVQPTGETRQVLGDVELLIKIAKAPLDEGQRGIAISSNRVWQETTLAGAEGREMSQYIFGEFDVPALDADTSPIPAYDLSRSMELNRSNASVQTILAFVGEHVDRVRRELVDNERARKASEETKRLARQASAIAHVINADFASFRQQVARARALESGHVDVYAGLEPSANGQHLVPGGDTPAERAADTGGIGADGGDGGAGSSPRNLAAELTRSEPDGPERGRPAAEPKRPSAGRGGFSVEFRQMGTENVRARYQEERRVISINLDHPQLVAARGSNTADDVSFQRLAYEIAFTEYAIALASELAREGHFMDLTDPIQDIRATINRIASASAMLYEAR